jgi:hypothetical protein
MSVGSGPTSSSAAAERPQPLAGSGSEAPAGRSFFSSGERSGAKNAGVPQNQTDAPLEKTTDEFGKAWGWAVWDIRRVSCGGGLVQFGWWGFRLVGGGFSRGFRIQVRGVCTNIRFVCSVASHRHRKQHSECIFPFTGSACERRADQR